MNKTVLITGSTKGIGKFTAFAMANKGYSVHVLGRDITEGKRVLDRLMSINSKGEHQFFECNLSSKDEVIQFLKMYTSKFTSLDVLILNAGIYNTKKQFSLDGIDVAFSVGYISRYIFSVLLNPLLERSIEKKVLHICGSVVGDIQYDKLEKVNYSPIKGVWQNSVGSAFLVSNWSEISDSQVAHAHWNPGVVNTNTVKSQSKLIQFLSKLAGMKEPDAVGLQIAKAIAGMPTEVWKGAYFSKGKSISPSLKRIKDKHKLSDLLNFSEAFTGIKSSYSNVKV